MEEKRTKKRVFHVEGLERRIEDADNILPCPFCGSTDNMIVMSRRFFDELVVENGTAMLSMHCEHCSMELKEYNKDDCIDYDVVLERLLAKWNERH